MRSVQAISGVYSGLIMLSGLIRDQLGMSDWPKGVSVRETETNDGCDLKFWSASRPTQHGKNNLAAMDAVPLVALV